MADASMSNWTAYQIGIAVLMVVTGSINTLAAKWADRIKALGVNFDHPFLQVSSTRCFKRKKIKIIKLASLLTLFMQAVCMFIGEFLCLAAFFIVYAYRKWQYNRRSGYSEMRERGEDLGKILLSNVAASACMQLLVCYFRASG